MIWQHNDTDIQVGDEFKFRGLRGQDVERTTLTVKCVLTDGVLVINEYRHETDVNVSFSMQYADALAMIEQRIWYNGPRES